MRALLLLVALLGVYLMFGSTSATENPRQPFNPENWRSNVVELLGDLGFAPPVKIPSEPSRVDKILFSGLAELVATNAFGPRFAFRSSYWGRQEKPEEQLLVILNREVPPKWEIEIRSVWSSVFDSNSVRIHFWNEIDAMTGTPAWYEFFTVRELKPEFKRRDRIDFNAVWSAVVRCVQQVVKLDSETEIVTADKRVVKSHWKVHPGPYTNSVLSEQFEVKMLTDSDLSARISIEPLVKIRGKESARERIFRGGMTSLTMLNRGYHSDEDALIKSIQSKLYSTNVPAIGPNDTK